MARRRDVFQLTNDELSILCWLRISNGQAILSASAVAENSLFVVPDRLLQDGFVRTQMLSPTTVHYTLTESGREVLEICEGTAWPRHPSRNDTRPSRTSTPGPCLLGGVCS